MGPISVVRHCMALPLASHLELSLALPPAVPQAVHMALALALAVPLALLLVRPPALLLVLLIVAFLCIRCRCLLGSRAGIRMFQQCIH